jgi:hypothetical protein
MAVRARPCASTASPQHSLQARHSGRTRPRRHATPRLRLRRWRTGQGKPRSAACDDRSVAACQTRQQLNATSVASTSGARRGRSAAFAAGTQRMPAICSGCGPAQAVGCARQAAGPPPRRATQGRACTCGPPPRTRHTRCHGLYAARAAPEKVEALAGAQQLGGERGRHEGRPQRLLQPVAAAPQRARAICARGARLGRRSPGSGGRGCRNTRAHCADCTAAPPALPAGLAGQRRRCERRAGGARRQAPAPPRRAVRPRRAACFGQPSLGALGQGRTAGVGRSGDEEVAGHVVQAALKQPAAHHVQQRRARAPQAPLHLARLGLGLGRAGARAPPSRRAAAAPQPASPWLESMRVLA